MKDKDSQVRGYAAGVLGGIGRPAVPTLVKAVQSGDREARQLGHVLWRASRRRAGVARLFCMPAGYQQAACATCCTIWWIAPCMTVMS